MGFKTLFIASLKMFYRNRAGFFWTLGMPLIIYCALSFLPIGKLVGGLGVQYSTFFLPGLIAMTIMQAGIYGLAYRMVDLKARGVLKRFSVTPITKVQFIGGLLGSLLAMMVMQAALLSIAGTLLFKVPIQLDIGNIIFILLFIVVGGGTFLLLGLLIARFADTYESAAPITTGIGLPMTFLSSIFYPIQTLPHFLQIVAKILPITHFAQGLRLLYLEPFHWTSIQMPFFVLLIWFTALAALSVSLFRLED